MRDLRASRAAKDTEVRIAPTVGVLVVEDLPEVLKGDTPKNWNKRPQYHKSMFEVILNLIYRLIKPKSEFRVKL